MNHKNKKYDWEIGTELPQLDEHSETKHLIIADYLKRGHLKDDNTKK
jgi:hypothetical protein